ncbi:uncharacterized protein LOC135316629 [Phalacrocorax carbo]|uniref:uncharacterized protein LOC135316629 n=1 Tax=Phalacrocorax carbo TaxID=9209 RepID=UPI0031199492
MPPPRGLALVAVACTDGTSVLREATQRCSCEELPGLVLPGARPAERLLSRGRLSPVRTGGLGLTGEKRGKAGTAAGSVSVLPPIEGTRAEKRKEARATDRPQVWLPPLDSRLGAAEAKSQSEILQVKWPDLRVRLPWPKSSTQERAEVQAGQEEVISWAKRDGEEISYCHPRAEKGKIPAPPLETPQPDIRSPRARQVLAKLERYRSRQQVWKRKTELNRLQATVPKEVHCMVKKMELHGLREKHEAGATAYGTCAQYGHVAPRRPAARR